MRDHSQRSLKPLTKSRGTIPRQARQSASVRIASLGRVSTEGRFAVFFLTDINLMSRQDIAERVSLAGRARFQAVQFGQVTGLGGSGPLKQLAKATGGRIAPSTCLRSADEPAAGQAKCS